MNILVLTSKSFKFHYFFQYLSNNIILGFERFKYICYYLLGESCHMPSSKTWFLILVSTFFYPFAQMNIFLDLHIAPTIYFFSFETMSTRAHQSQLNSFLNYQPIIGSCLLDQSGEVHAQIHHDLHSIQNHNAPNLVDNIPDLVLLCRNS
ncbi:hypothetical protein ES319_D12G174800v1 [Gossypium barbadense]|uniref:Uncharacterized protein n=2 Tax=Gossypium TaxID=3633 RepID=A0A5J5NZD2_GOSBA|nr:hypothetical protein ES319_D12G174800v1 [Gossypium barbadense]TYG41549.1 hypothetical protein ES288_D12G184500v1 [Gossypium darwinii]